MIPLGFNRRILAGNLLGSVVVLVASAVFLSQYSSHWTGWIAGWTAVEGLTVVFGIIDCLYNRPELKSKIFLVVITFVYAIKSLAGIGLLVELCLMAVWTPEVYYLTAAYYSFWFLQSIWTAIVFAAIIEESRVFPAPPAPAPPLPSVPSLRTALDTRDVTTMASRLGVVVDTSQAVVCPVCNETTDSVVTCVNGHPHCVFCLAGWMVVSGQTLRCTVCRGSFPGPQEV